MPKHIPKRLKWQLFLLNDFQISTSLEHFGERFVSKSSWGTRKKIGDSERSRQ